MGVWLYQVWLYHTRRMTPKYWVWHLSSDQRFWNITSPIYGIRSYMPQRMQISQDRL